MEYNSKEAVKQLLEMNAAKIAQIKKQHNDACEKNQADDSPLFKALETKNISIVAGSLKYWYEKATRNGHYKKGEHRYLVNTIQRLIELFPGDENGTYVARGVQLKQPEFTYYLLAGISYKMAVAAGYSYDGEQEWSPNMLADKVLPRLEVALVDLFINRISPYVGGRTGHALNAPKKGYTNRKESWERQRQYAAEDAVKLIRDGKIRITEDGLEALKSPMDVMFPTDEIDERGRKLYDLKKATLFIITEALCYHYREGEDGYDEKLAKCYPFLYTREQPKIKYSARKIVVNPAIKQARDEVLDRITLDENRIVPPTGEDDTDILADFCFVYRGLPYKPLDWKYTGESDRHNHTGGFADETLRSLCALHKKRGSEADTISSKARIDFINKLQATEFEINKPVLELAKHLHANLVTIDGLACRHPITKAMISEASHASCVLEPRIASKREFLDLREQELVQQGVVIPRDQVDWADTGAVRAREAKLKEYRNGDTYGERWKQIRKGLEALNSEIHSQNDNAISSNLSLTELTRLSTLDKFHYVVQVDARLRIYFVSNNSSPLAGNLNRWCHQFHQGQVLTDGGLQELKLAIGTSVLGNKVSINARRVHAEQYWDEYLDMGRDLIANEYKIRTEIKPDEFWYFCALISGLAQYEVSGIWKVPVSRDASASGIGWWSVLTGDELGCKLCNLIDTDDDSTAGDAYMVMLGIVSGWVKDRDPRCKVRRRVDGKGKPTKKALTPNEWTQLDALFSSDASLRSAAKALVMISSYGAGQATCLKEIKAVLPEYTDFIQVFLASTLTRAMQEVFSGCYSAMIKVKDAYSFAMAHKDGETSEKLAEELTGLREQLAALLKEQKLLDEETTTDDIDGLFDVLDEFKVSKIGPLKGEIRLTERVLAESRYQDELTNGKLTWEQADGSVVHHCKLLQTKSNLSLPGHGELKFMQRSEHTRDAQKARVAAPPDFIHSCDSTQLALAFNAMTGPGYSIHDCVYVLPGDMDDALEQLKKAMLTIVEFNPLVKLIQGWSGWTPELPKIENLQERIMNSSLYWN